MPNKSKKILTEISAGELLDKICILEIKLNKIKDSDSQTEIKKEHLVLKNTEKSNIKITPEILKLVDELKIVNTQLWEIEDKLRIYEKDKNFKSEFIDLARNVYLNNDKRSVIKSKINKLLGSNIREIKQYVKY